MANWIKGAIKHPGALKRKAKAKGESVSQMIDSPPKNASAQTKKQISLAKTLRGLRSRHGISNLKKG